MVKNSRDHSANKNVWFETRKGGVIASSGVVATNHPLASSVGVEAMAHGGNAFDAAVASLFALTVVEPMMVGIFGAGFFVIRNGETGEITTIDNYAVAPRAATDTMYRMVEGRQPGQNIFETGGRKNQVGHLAVATPGTLKAWEHIVDNYGELSLEEVIRPAIRFAREGFRASPYLSYVVEQFSADLGLFAASAKMFLPDGKVLKPGQRVLMLDYAETLEKIAEKGSDVLYRGELGRGIVDDMATNGGLITMEDLASYRLIERDPVKGVYRDEYEIYAMAPGSSGGTHIIQMLNILEASDMASLRFGSIEHLHLMAEVLKISFADRQRYMGDPILVDIPVEGLTSKEYAVERAQQIGENAKIYTSGDPLAYIKTGGDTTHLSTMDSEGNMVAATQTLNNAFGSKVTVMGTGVLLNNCMALFDPRPGRANSVAGEKRMLSSMSPTIVIRKGEPFLCIGTPGGLGIFPSVCQAIVNIVDFGMTLQQAVEAPRIWTMGIKGTPGEKLTVEDGFPEETRMLLSAKGHDVIPVPKVAGGMNGVMRDPETGLLHGGACWRADGTPMGVSGGGAARKAMEPPPLY
jgi:gamma-glutamyltranspeptidase/glutathione hydrolase